MRTSRSILGAAVGDLNRLRHISRVLFRHGFSRQSGDAGLAAADSASMEGEEAQVEDAARSPNEAALRFRMVLQDLGPTFVKVGQILSTRPDLLPPPFIAELVKLQDAAERVPFEEIRGVVEAELGGRLEAHFASFDERPLASASMAQAHLALLPDGREVVVKVQRPGIAETIRADLDLLKVLARVLDATIQEMELYAPRDLVAALDSALTGELDFRREADNLRRFQAMYAENENIRVPACIESHSRRRVLTMERIRGRKVTALESGSEEAKAFARHLLELTYTSVFTHGFVHADPHPGNLFATDDGQLGLIDFGMCGSLSVRDRDLIVSLVLSVVSGDADGIARSLLRMGHPMGHVPMARFKADIADIRERYLRRSLHDIDLSAFLDECMDAAQHYRIRIGGEYTILSKSVVTIEGVIRELDPEFDIVAETKPYANRLLRERFAPDNLLQSGAAAALHLSNLAREVPDQISQVLMDLEGGSLQLRVRSEELEAVRQELNRQTTRLSGALFCGVLFLSGIVLLPSDPLVWRGLPLIALSMMLLAIGGGTLVIFSHVLASGVSKLRVGWLIRLLRRR